MNYVLSLKCIIIKSAEYVLRHFYLFDKCLLLDYHFSSAILEKIHNYLLTELKLDDVQIQPPQSIPLSLLAAPQVATKLNQTHLLSCFLSKGFLESWQVCPLSLVFYSSNPCLWECSELTLSLLDLTCNSPLKTSLHTP